MCDLYINEKICKQTNDNEDNQISNNLFTNQQNEKLQVPENQNFFNNNNIQNNSINNDNHNDTHINNGENEDNETSKDCKKENIKEDKRKLLQKHIGNNKNQNDERNKTDMQLDEKYMIDLKDYKDLNIILGFGSYGSVSLVENIHTHEKYAAKISLNNYKFNDIYHEIHFYSKYMHPLILSLHGYSLYDFKQKESPILLLENMRNKSLDTLFKNMKKSNQLKQIFKAKRYIILLGIAKGIHFLHKKEVVHRDLKPGNILLDENFYPRINDFGSAIIYSEKNKLFKMQEKEKAGTLLYWSPEVLVEEEPYSFKADVYAFSMIAYELLTGIEPFAERKYTKKIQIASDIKNGIRPDLSMIPDLEIQVFFQKCWSSEPSERPDFPEIIQTLKSSKFKLAFQSDEKEYYQFLNWYNEKLSSFDKNDIISQEKIEILNEIFDIRLKLLIDIPNSNELAFTIRDSVEDLKLMYYLLPFKEYLIEQYKLQRNIIGLIQYADKYYDDDYYDAVLEYINNSNLSIEEAMYKFALILKNGLFIPPDIREAIFQFKLSSRFKCADSTLEIAKIFEYGDGIEKNLELAVPFYKKAAIYGNIESMYKYGLMLKNGIGVEMNKKEAAFFLELSADLGNSNSMFEFAKMLEIGDGIEKNYEKSAMYYKRASYFQNTDAMTNLGLLLISGNIPIDIPQSIKYFKMAIQLGNDQAMLNYGKLLCKIALIEKYDENETIDNFKKASKYFQNAAEIGNEEAKTKFAIFFSDGTFQTEKKSEVCEFLNAALNESIKDFALNLNSASNPTTEVNDVDAKVNQKTINDVKVNTYKSYKNENNTSKYKYMSQYDKGLQSILKSDLNIARCIDMKEIFIRTYNIIKKAGISKEKIRQLSNQSACVVYIYLSNFTIPEYIRKEIDNRIKSLNILKKCQYKICHQKDPNDLFDFYYFNVKWSDKIRKIMSNIFKKYGFESFMPLYTEIPPFEHYLYFNETMIPDQIKQLFLFYLQTLDGIIEIKRNIFDGRQIGTYLIIYPNSETRIIQKIRNFLYSKGMLFNTYKYPLQNNIIINEKMILQNHDDFDIIVKEIESIGIKPINVERNKLYSYDDYSLKKLFQIFSFICFKDSKDKMKALNHINSIIFKGHENILHYDENLHYATLDDSFHAPSIRNIFPKLFQSFKGVEDFQRYVLSIENPVERIYIGFDSNKHLKKCSYKYIFRVNMLDEYPNIKLFWKKKGLIYLYVRYPSGKYQSRFGESITKKISNFADDIQYNCSDLVYFEEINKSVFYLATYLGYKTIELFEKAISMIENDSIFTNQDIQFGKYKEGYGIINLVNESKEAFIYYESL